MSHLWTCLRPLSWCLWGLLCMSCGTRTWRLWYRAWTKKLVQPFIFPITSGCAPDVVPVVARAFCFKLGADYCKPVGWPDGGSAHMFWYIVNEVRKDLEAKGFVGKEIKANLCCRGGRGGWVLLLLLKDNPVAEKVEMVVIAKRRKEQLVLALCIVHFIVVGQIFT